MGEITVKGRGEPASVYEVFDGDAPRMFDLKNETKVTFEEAVRLFYDGRFSESHGKFAEVVGANPDDPAARYYSEKAAHRAMRKKPRD